MTININKRTITAVIVIALLFIGIHHLVTHTKSRKIWVNVEVMDKLTTQSRDGNQVYYVLVEKRTYLEMDGSLHESIVDSHVQATEYYRAKVGHKYKYESTDFYYE